MAQQQEEGWPLGLGLLNDARIGFVGNGDFSGSVSFTNMLTRSTIPSSFDDSSTDLDTQSTGSFFHERRSITLGSLIGISSFLQLSRRSSTRGEQSTRDNNSNIDKKNHNNNNKVKPYHWLFSSLCSKNDDAIAPPSLGQYLEAERRRAATSAQRRRNQCETTVCSSPSLEEGNESDIGAWEQSNNGYGEAPIVFSCLCGFPSS